MSDDEAMGESFRVDGMDEGNIGDGRAMGAKDMADDEEGMGDEGAMGTNPGITEKEGIDTWDRIEGREVVGNKVAGDDGNQMSGEGMDAEDGIEDQEAVGNGGGEDMGINNDINDAVGAAPAAPGDEDSDMGDEGDEGSDMGDEGDEDSDMGDEGDKDPDMGDEGEIGKTSGMDASAKMEWAGTSADRNLRPRPHTLPGFKENASPPKPPPKRAKNRLPNKQENASPQPGSYALPIDVDAWTVGF